jgi:polysaccharide export outer membrane protein
MKRSLRPHRLLLAAGLLSLSCAAGSYTWVDDYAPPAPPHDPGKEYVIGPGDMLSVRVFNQDQMSARERVRSDGKVGLPFLNDVAAAGFTPRALAAQLQTRLRDFINNPVVTVNVEEPRGIPITVAGEVIKPGLYSAEPGSGVLQGLILAGGLTEYGGRDRIYVIRAHNNANGVTRIRFQYWALVRGEGKSPLFQLKPGDTIVVE